LHGASNSAIFVLQLRLPLNRGDPPTPTSSGTNFAHTSRMPYIVHGSDLFFCIIEGVKKAID
jgi:hypothetical protein